MPDFTSVCVFCGSKPGDGEAYASAARDLGQRIAAEGCELVYGGGDVGLMGIVADAVSGAGGHVAGFIPRFLDEWEVGRRHSDEFHITDSMHERKERMADRADAFVVLPGGLGTLDETFEIITWKQLRLHTKPIVLLSVGGYWTHMTALIDHMIGAGFVSANHRALFSVVEHVDEVFPELRRTLGKP